MKTQLESAVQWLEQKQKTLKAVTEDQVKFESEFFRGFNEGIKYANKSYLEEIQQLRQLLDGFLVEDVNLDGMESEQHAS